MKTVLLATLAVTLSSALSSCASKSRGLRITSDPDGAQVSLISPTGEVRDLGTTPYEFSDAQMAVHAADVIGFKFQKEGFENERFYVEKPSRSFQGEIKVKLFPSADWSQAFFDKKAAKYLEDVARLTAEIQGAVAASDLPRGEQKARAMTTRYPGLAVGWSLLGNVLYKQNRKSEALEAYNKSLSLEPNSPEIKAVIEKIRGA